MVRFGVIGYGYWGPNIVRNLHNVSSAKVVAVCDKTESSLQKARRAYPDVHVTTDASELLCSPDIDAVAVITPVWTHFELAKEALENGKHVFVEKPFTSTAQQAEELIELAERKNLTIMVDHTFLFTGAVRKITPADRRRTLWASSTTTTPPGSTWAFSSTTSTCSGTWRRTISPSWTT